MRQRISVPMRFAALSGLALALMLSASAAARSGAHDDDDDDDGRTVPFEEAEVFVELNDTDGDLGIHASIDGGPWTRLEIEDPRGRELLHILSKGRLQRQGLTQLFFESAEPTFDELSPEQFFRRFPEGEYEIEGKGQHGVKLESSALFSHVLAAPPGNILVGGVPAAEDCDADILPKVFPPVVIDWDPVTQSHPEIGKAGPIEVRRYQFFVERNGVSLAVDLPPDVTQFEVPTAITDLGKEFKFEIIVQTETGNNTAVESCFEVP